MFRHYSKYFNNITDISLKNFLIKKYSKITADHILSCHNLYTNIIKRFVTFRLKIFNKKNAIKCKKYDSKSMAMHTLFK